MSVYGDVHDLRTAYWNDQNLDALLDGLTDVLDWEAPGV